MSGQGFDRISSLVEWYARPRGNCANEKITVPIEVPPLPNGKSPQDLEIYAVAEAYGYVTGLRLNRMASPHGLVMGARKV